MLTGERPGIARCLKHALSSSPEYYISPFGDDLRHGRKYDHVIARGECDPQMGRLGARCRTVDHGLAEPGLYEVRRIGPESPLCLLELLHDT